MIKLDFNSCMRTYRVFILLNSGLQEMMNKKDIKKAFGGIKVKISESKHVPKVTSVRMTISVPADYKDTKVPISCELKLREKASARSWLVQTRPRRYFVES